MKPRVSAPPVHRQSPRPNASCYLCGSTTLEVLTTELREASGQVWRCRACDLGILQADPALDLKSYYARFYRASHGPVLGTASDPQLLFDSYRPYQTRRVGHIRHLLKPQSRVLDVGCSAGQFLIHIKSLVKEIVGTDYDEASATFAARVCECKTYTQDLRETGLSKNYFDVISVLQTLHHIPDPRDLLLTLRDYLAPNGHVFIEVPNLHTALLSLYKNEAYRRFHFHRDHYFYFTRPSLQQLMESAGFIGEVAFVQDYNFLNHVHWQMAMQPQPNCHIGMGRSRLAFPLDTAPGLSDSLNALLDETDDRYKSLLEETGLASNLVFLGRRR